MQRLVDRALHPAIEFKILVLSMSWVAEDAAMSTSKGAVAGGVRLQIRQTMYYSQNAAVVQLLITADTGGATASPLESSRIGNDASLALLAW